MTTSHTYVVLVLVGVLLIGSLPVQAGWKQDRFMVTVWCWPPAEDKALADYADEGYTMTVVPADKLDLARKYHLQAMVTDSLLQVATLDTADGRAKLDDLINRVKKHPAMQGYYLTDEPGVSAFEGWGKLVAYLKERDPKHLAYINLYPTYASPEQLNLSADEIRKTSTVGDQIFLQLAAEKGSVEVAKAYKQYLERFVEVVKPELISYDHYHFFTWGDGEQYFLNLELIRSAALKAKLPFLNIIQGSAFIGDWRRPTLAEMRFLVYTTIAYGGRGISYFTYWGPESYHGLYEDGKRTPHALDAAILNKEVDTLSPTLMKLNSIGVYHTKDLPFGASPVPVDCPIQVDCQTPCVLGLFGDKASVDAFMLVNRDYKNPAQANLTLKGIRSLRELDRKTGRWQNYAKVTKDQPISVTLEAGEGRLFRIAR